MKTKIITLESHDDLISVRDKLSWAKTPRILLVWPKYEKVTLRMLDLKVLQRHADSLGAQLGLVTRRANVRRDAESLNIPVFSSSASAQRDPWTVPAPRTKRTPPPPRRDLRAMRDTVTVTEPAWRTSLLGRVITFSVGVAAVLVIAGLFVPRAAVTLYPESQTNSITIPVSASPSITTVTLAGDVPAREVRSSISAERTVTVTSQIAIPKSKAKGVAQFTNLEQSELTIPAGTVIATEALVRFVTLNDTRLPAGADEIVEVQIEALEAGSQGNVEADAIQFIEGPLGLSATVTNPENTSGGADTKVIGASEEDRTALRELVLEDLLAVAESQLHSQIETNDLLLTDTLEIVEITSEDYSPPEIEASTSLTLSMQADVSVLYISVDDLDQLASSSLSASVPEGFGVFGEMEFDLLDTPVTDASGVTYFQLQASQTALRNVDVSQVFNLIRGLTPMQAQTELRNSLALRQDPQIVMTPSWWKWLPLIPFNLLVEIK